MTAFDPSLPSQRFLSQCADLKRLIQVKQFLSLPFFFDQLHDVYRTRRTIEEGEWNGPLDCMTTNDLRFLFRDSLVEFMRLDLRFAKPADTNNYCPHDLYGLPGSSAQLAMISIGNNDKGIIWCIDFSDITKGFDLITPQRHLIFTGVQGFVWKTS